MAQDGLSDMPQLKNGWQSMEPDPMGKYKGFWNWPGFNQRVKASVDFGGNAAADVSGEKPADIVWTSDVRPCGRVSREDAKARKVGDRVPQLPKTFFAMRVSWSAPA
jgi:hypothetical protein